MMTTTLVTRRGDFFKVPKISKYQAQTILPSALFKTLLNENPNVPWAHYTRSNFAEIVFHIASTHRLLLEPRPLILPPFPHVNEAASVTIQKDWAYVTMALDLPLPATPSSIAISSSRDGPCHAFEYRRHVYGLPKISMKIFYNVDGMPDLDAFLAEITHIHSAEVPVLKDEGFVRHALQSFRLKAFPNSECTIQTQFEKLVDIFMMKHKSIRIYRNACIESDGLSRLRAPVIYDTNCKSADSMVRHGPSATSHHPLTMVGAGCITSNGAGQPFDESKFCRISGTHWDLLQSENRTLKIKIRGAFDNKGENEMTKWKAKVYEDILTAGGKSLHYAFWIGTDEIYLVYNSSQHRNEAIGDISRGADCMKHIRDKHIQKLSGHWARSYMTWEIPQEIVSTAKELQDVLNSHFEGTGYSSRYTHSATETLEETIAITFHNVPPWLGDKIIKSGRPGQIAARPSLYSAEPHDGPLNERGQGYRFLGTKRNGSSSSATRAVTGKSENYSQPVPACDPKGNPGYKKMIETSAARLGGITESLELAGDLSLPYLNFRTFLGELKHVMYPTERRIEQLFMDYMQFIEDGFPTSSKDDKVEAFMRAGGDLPVRMETKYAVRVAAMRKWRKWINMPDDPKIIEILVESQPEKLVGHLPPSAKPSVATADTSSTVKNQAIGKKRKRAEDIRSQGT